MDINKDFFTENLPEAFMKKTTISITEEKINLE
jgi:hypothetical protein